jgi:hypothetical protein
MSTGKAQFVEKGRCQRCWREFPVTMLRKQEGQLRCIISCTDDLSTTRERRQRIIDDKIASGNEGSSSKPEMFSDPGESRFE